MFNSGLGGKIRFRSYAASLCADHVHITFQLRGLTVRRSNNYKREIMNLRTLQILLLLQNAWTNVVIQGCREATYDMCSSSRSAGAPDTRVAPLTEGSCDFERTLCSYRQECTDNVNLQWQIIANPGYIQFTGLNGCMFQYLVLESPMLNINTLSCLELAFSRSSPSQLAVFLTNSTSVVTLMPQTNQSNPDSSNVQHVQKTVHSAQAKLRFRGFSGGGSLGYVRIDSVSLRHGGCEDPACQFEDDFCGWENVCWTFSSGAAGEGRSAGLSGVASSGILQSPLARSTECEINCLQFIFKMSGRQDILSVSLIRASGERLFVWMVKSNDTAPTTWNQATIPVRIGEAFQVRFEATREVFNESEIGIDHVSYVRNQGLCTFSPAYATMGSYRTDSVCDIVTDSIITPQPPIKSTDTTFDRSSVIVTRSGAISYPDLSDSGDTIEIAAIAAPVAVAGGVAVIVVIIVCFICVRRKRRRQSNRKANDFSVDGTAVSAKRQEQQKGQRVSSEATGTNADLDNGGDYSLVTENASPYEIAAVGTNDAKTPRSLVYDVLNLHSSGQNLPKRHGYNEDNYNHISTSQPADVDISALYSQVQKKGKRAATGQHPSDDQGPDPGAAYSQVRKGKRATPVQRPPEVLYPSAVYNQVRKGKKPPIANKPAIPKEPDVKDPYNKIDFSALKSTEHSKPADDMYNKLDEVHQRDPNM